VVFARRVGFPGIRAVFPARYRTGAIGVGVLLGTFCFLLLCILTYVVCCM
jgi:hypothetical protein